MRIRDYIGREVFIYREKKITAQYIVLKASVNVFTILMLISAIHQMYMGRKNTVRFSLDLDIRKHKYVYDFWYRHISTQESAQTRWMNFIEWIRSCSSLKVFGRERWGHRSVRPYSWLFHSQILLSLSSWQCGKHLFILPPTLHKRWGWHLWLD